MTVVAIQHQALIDDLERQIAHWLAAARTFRDAEEFASSEAWRSVEREIGAPLRQQLNTIVDELIAMGESAAKLIGRARREAGLIRDAQSAVQKFRRRYIQVDTTLDYIGDAVNSRTSPLLRAALSSLDRLAVASMAPVLERAGKPVPPGRATLRPE